MLQVPLLFTRPRPELASIKLITLLGFEMFINHRRIAGVLIEKIPENSEVYINHQRIVGVWAMEKGRRTAFAAESCKDKARASAEAADPEWAAAVSLAVVMIRPCSFRASSQCTVLMACRQAHT
jgi:hypothetical protein